MVRPLAHLSKSGVASVRALAQRIYLTVDLWPARELVAVACVVHRKTGQIRLAGRERMRMCVSEQSTARAGKDHLPNRMRVLASSAAIVSTFALGAIMVPQPGHAQDATWTTAPASGDWNTAANWNPNGVPTGTATFGASSNTAIGTNGRDVQLGTMKFNSDAPGYTFFATASNLLLGGQGIVNSSSSSPIFKVGGDDPRAASIQFENASKAGNAVITSNAHGFILFIDNSTADHATIVTGGFTQFFNNATGGDARFITNAGGQLDISPLRSDGMTAGSIEGAGLYLLGSKTLTVGSNNLSTTVSGVIADRTDSIRTGGSLVKVGTGTLTLSGINTYTGMTAVNDGTLAVNGSIASSAVRVNTGGTLAGNGTVGATTVAGGGTLAPGAGAIGTLNVAGNLGFAPGSFYAVRIDGAGHSDKLAVSGAGTISGGTVQVTPVNALAINTPYAILTAAGGVTGTFSNVTGPAFTFISPMLTYDPHDVFLTFARNDVAFASVGQTRNQIATGAAVDSLGHGALFNTVAFGTTAQARLAFDQLSGEIHASAAGAMVDGSHFVRDAVIDRLRQTYGAALGPMAALGARGPALAFAGDAGADAGILGYAGPLITKAAPLPQQPVITSWTQAVGTSGQTDSDANAASLKQSTAGFITGLDATFDARWRFGLAGGYTQSSLHVDDRSSSATLNNYHLAAYGGGQLGGWGLRGGAAFTWHDIDSNRVIVFPGFFDATKASYSAHTAQAFGEISHAFALGYLAAEPFAGLAYVHLDGDRFTETGGAAALTGTDDTLGVAFTTMGLRAATTLVQTGGKPLTVNGTLAWRHAFGDVTPQTLLTFRDGGAPFTVAGVPIARDSLLVEAGLGIDLTANASIGITYSGQLARDAHDHGAKGNFTWRF
jgi:outer membrane autotransporter protein